MFLMIGSTPAGSAVTGFVANTLDVRVALQINATICIVGLILSMLYLRRSSASLSISREELDA
jgi:hypothetical protein